uniref:Uncharacterized protein n=1 Tax=Dicentrarchus labrax TaxID=13489 RepID=A0A8P4KE64_DICLA
MIVNSDSVSGLCLFRTPEFVKGKHVWKSGTYGDFSTDGQVYTWGQDSRGQLGLGKRKAGANSPQHLRSLSAIPLVQIAAGGEQSFALSVSGGVFGWGRNDCGQLGLGDTTGKISIYVTCKPVILCPIDRHTPTSVHSLIMKKTVHVSCGKDHTAILTKDGAVFTFGSGKCGQLGHNSFRDELRPRLVAELWGAKVTKIACGRYRLITNSVQARFDITSSNCDCFSLQMAQLNIFFQFA